MHAYRSAPPTLDPREFKRQQPFAGAAELRRQAGELDFFERQRGGRELVRRIVPGGGYLDGIQNVEQLPGVGGSNYSPQIAWADGSILQSDGTYKWLDGSAGHAAPKSPATVFGPSLLGYWAWGVNVFPCWISNSVNYDGQGAPANTLVTVNGTLDLLDANGNMLSQAIWTMNELIDASLNFTASQAVTLGAGTIPNFNAVRSTLNVTGMAVYQLITNLFYFLQQPMEL